MKHTKVGNIDLYLHPSARMSTNVRLIGSGKIVLGERSQVRDYSVIEMSDGLLEIGKDTVVGYQSMIQCTGVIQIGNNTLLGPQNVLIASYHPESFDPSIQKTLVRSRIDIKDNVWTGAQVVINQGVTVGKDSVIGASSFVRSDVDEGTVVAGTPARLLRMKKGRK